ncbi:MAG: gamma-glutamylcyclotransferase family protein [Nanoarchaeota archaeon]|nr:gamma-glutamylcyclotransferase family protein [Nanoarchaeota archaeon]
MKKLFVYGTLKNPEIQKSIFGRIAQSSPDVLQGYTRSKIRIDKIYPIIIKKRGKFVRGLVISVNPKELKLIDKYETNSYKRQKVALKSGTNAQVYTR